MKRFLCYNISITCFIITNIVATDASSLKRRDIGLKRSLANISGQPTFTSPPRNVTVIEEEEVTLTCSVSALHEYKLAWVHEDSQSIISIGRQLYTHSKRLSLAADHRTAAITISPVLASDRGWYMCQINTDPMTSSHSFLQVLVPPTLKEWSGPEIEAREGSTVRLICLARAYPPAQVTWRRTDAQPVFKGEDGKLLWVIEGIELEFPIVSREHSATYTCHIDNKETPPISRDTQLMITYPPMVWLQEELIGVRKDYDVTLSCITDANPPPLHSWLKNGTQIKSDDKHRVFERVQGTSWQMLLTIRNTQPEDLVRYSCIATNPIGQAEGTILLYEIKEQLLIPAPETVSVRNYKEEQERKAEEESRTVFSTTFYPMNHKMSGDILQRNRDVSIWTQDGAHNKSNFFKEVTLIEEISSGIKNTVISELESIVPIIILILFCHLSRFFLI